VHVRGNGATQPIKEKVGGIVDFKFIGKAFLKGGREQGMRRQNGENQSPQIKWKCLQTQAKNAWRNKFHSVVAGHEPMSVMIGQEEKEAVQVGRSTG
jgi:hypothetical protein